MKTTTLIISLILCWLSLSGCDRRMKDYQSPAVKSPSGRYMVFAKVNRTNLNKIDYAYVIIHLTDAMGNEIQNYRTQAVDGRKWALGWMGNEDIVILQSSTDVGSMAFRIENETLVKIATMSDEMIARAWALRVQKYGTPNN